MHQVTQTKTFTHKYGTPASHTTGLKMYELLLICMAYISSDITSIDSEEQTISDPFMNLCFCLYHVLSMSFRYSLTFSDATAVQTPLFISCCSVCFQGND